MVILLYIFAFVVHILLVLTPYYVAYLIIEPHSFLGVVGVFLLGSVIVPLSIFLAGLCVAAIGGVIGVSADVIKNKKNIENNYGYSSEIITVNEVSSDKKSKKKIVVFSLVGFVIFSVIIGVIEENKEDTNYYEPAPIAEDVNSYDDSVSDLSAVSEVDSSSVFSATSSNNYIEDDYQLMNQAVNTTLNTVDKVGISGMAKNVRDCYVNSNLSKLYCVYLDNSARLLDIAVTSSYQMTRNEYLSDTRSRERANEYLYLPWNIGDSDSHFQEMQSTLWKILGNAVRNRVSYTSNQEQNSSTQAALPVQENNFENEMKGMNEKLTVDENDELTKKNIQIDPTGIPDLSNKTNSDMTKEEVSQHLSE